MNERLAGLLIGSGFFLVGVLGKKPFSNLKIMKQKGEAVQLQLLGHGNFTVAYRGSDDQVYLKVKSTGLKSDRSKEMISQMAFNKHLPQLDYLGKTTAPDDVPTQKRMFKPGGEWDLYRSPFYSKVKKPYNIQQIKELNRALEDWYNTEFYSVCAYGIENYINIDLLKTDQSAVHHDLRESFLWFLYQNYKVDQKLVQSLIDIHNHISEVEKEDGYFFEFPIRNFGESENGDLILMDVVYPSLLVNCKRRNYGQGADQSIENFLKELDNQLKEEEHE